MTASTGTDTGNSHDSIPIEVAVQESSSCNVPRRANAHDPRIRPPVVGWNVDKQLAQEWIETFLFT